MARFFRCVFLPHIVVNALKVSLLVGTLLNVINQGSQLFDLQAVVWGQALLNYCVPFCVASYSAAKNELRAVRS